ncbi:hypothetical protein [Homoserinibacter sp. YIM 151385]|uniref:hypothetical protein n=1 Tax=Homoserinibacter sp. YIM 151385 TaxID=2985506 RepID=UPI0022F0ACF3|nr:hypothetical protein [Homoserinibacter sp. YIM 151385]WBU39211.1 hypothetical protein OF852_06450 [Homoserinibacter sp. YIM 151385]
MTAVGHGPTTGTAAPAPSGPAYTMPVAAPAGRVYSAMPTPAAFDAAMPTGPAHSFGVQTSAGWTTAAVAIHDARAAGAELLQLEVDDLGAILIDFRQGAFYWATPLNRFPIRPERAVALVPEAASVALTGLPRQRLDTLLWMIGITAFGGGPAPWLRGGDRYRVVRWPNFTELPHRDDYLRMTAALVTGHLSLSELATAAGTTISDAARIVTAFTLMGAADVSAVQQAPAALLVNAEDASRPSLWGRLRARLGRDR